MPFASSFLPSNETVIDASNITRADMTVNVSASEEPDFV
jgi:hypothetical protein